MLSFVKYTITSATASLPCESSDAKFLVPVSSVRWAQLGPNFLVHDSGIISDLSYIIETDKRSRRFSSSRSGYHSVNLVLLQFPKQPNSNISNLEQQTRHGCSSDLLGRVTESDDDLPMIVDLDCNIKDCTLSASPAVSSTETRNEKEPIDHRHVIVNQRQQLLSPTWSYSSTVNHRVQLIYNCCNLLQITNGRKHRFIMLEWSLQDS